MHNPLRWMRSLWLLVACLCAPLNAAAEDSALEGKLKLFERFEDNLAMPLAERIQTMPDDFLKLLIDFDKSIGIKNTDYKARPLTAGEKDLFMSYVSLLPGKYRTTFENKLLAVYFVDNFAGAGLTDWFVDKQGAFYYNMILNSALLKETLDGWLTYRENSFFTGGSPFSIKVRTGTDYKALLYGLLHEGAHIVDIEYHVTPFIDELHKEVLKQENEVSDFTRGIWEGQKKPVVPYDFNNRDRLNVYGIFDRELIPGGEMDVMFRQLNSTPFVSFYAGTAWYEDFADFITYHHIERNLGGSIRMELYRGERLVKRFYRTQNKSTSERKRIMQEFIREKS
jgi:hypothetical protein